MSGSESASSDDEAEEKNIPTMTTTTNTTDTTEADQPATTEQSANNAERTTRPRQCFNFWCSSTGVLLLGVASYVCFMSWVVHQLSYLPPCLPSQSAHECYPAWLRADDMVDVILFTSTNSDSKHVPFAENGDRVVAHLARKTLQETQEIATGVVFPPSVRLGKENLYLHVVVKHYNGANSLVLSAARGSIGSSSNGECASDENTCEVEQEEQEEQQEEFDDETQQEQWQSAAQQACTNSAAHVVIQLTELSAWSNYQEVRPLLQTTAPVSTDEQNNNSNNNIKDNSVTTADISSEQAQQAANKAAAQADYDAMQIARRLNVEALGGFEPHYRYLRNAVVVRYLNDQTTLGKPMNLQNMEGRGRMAYMRVNGTFQYLPTLIPDENALLRNSRVPIGPDSNRPPAPIRIRITPISMLRRSWVLMFDQGLKMLEQGLNDFEIDEIRYLLSDAHIYYFVLTQVISFIHMAFDFMAFKNDIGFFVGRTDMGGISASYIVSQFACSLIIFLYLLDGQGTSAVVLISIGSGTAVEAWKLIKILKPKFIWRFPFISIRDPSKLSSAEQATESHDVVARRYLWYGFGPLLIVYAVYALHEYQYTSWYSWLISSLANAVYAFGFIAMCPQLWINYKLKSVAHMPWKIFMYKVFQTFVDDVFAFIIKMPLLHKVMTLRDDVVFLGFLYQAYIYRVDKTRPNEYGIIYELPPEKETKKTSGEGREEEEVDGSSSHDVTDAATDVDKKNVERRSTSLTGPKSRSIHKSRNDLSAVVATGDSDSDALLAELTPNATSKKEQ